MKRIFFPLLIIIIFTGSIITLSSCKASYIRHGNKQIDSLYSILLLTEQKLVTLDTADIQQKYDLYSSTTSKLKNFETIEPQSEEWKTIAQYGHIRKPLRNLLQKLPYFYEELAFSKNQLDSLRYDLNKKLITEVQFNKYLNIEKQALDHYVQMFELYVNNAMNQLVAFDSLQPKVLLIIDQGNTEEGK